MCRRGPLGVVAVLSWVAGCADAGPTYTEHVRPILAERCMPCHQPGDIAPFPLTTYDEVYEARAVVADAVAERIMPPWLADPACADYVGDPTLSDEEIARVVEWVERGAPRGPGDDAAVRIPTKEVPGLPRVDRTVEMDEPYAPAALPDDYRCLVFEWPETEETFVTGIEVRPGPANILHHMILYASVPSGSERYRTLDAASPGPGYPCFGSVGGDDAYPVGGWVPGYGAIVAPKGVGIVIQPGAVLVVQAHYFVSDPHAGASDVTAIDFMLDDAVEREGFIIPLWDPLWVTQVEDPDFGLYIPALESNVRHTFSIDPTAVFATIYEQRFGRPSPLPAGAPMELFSAGFHMHYLGRGASASIRRSGADPTCLVEIPRWDFHWQSNYFFEEPKRLGPGEQLFIECRYDNTVANQPWVDGVLREPRDTFWGESSLDEMCVGIFLAAPPLAP